MPPAVNWRRFVLATAAIFIFALLWNALVHLILLADAETVLSQFGRPLAERKLWLGLLQTAATAALFIFSRHWAVHRSGLFPALCHGILFGLLAGLLVDLNQYLIYPIPASLALAWFAFGLIEFSLWGLIAAWLYPVAETPPER